jgi:hypothetical protein
MEDNKPVTTDPSESQSPTLEEEIRARILASVNEQKDSVNPLIEDTATEGGQSDVTTHAESNSDKAQSSVLSMIEASTGRKFASEDEAKKYLTNLNSLVGDQAVAKARDAAKRYEELVALATQQGKTEEDLKRTLADASIETAIAAPTKSKSKASAVDDELDERVAKLEDANQRLSLVNKYPYASDVQEEVAIIAKAKGVSYVEAFEKSQYKDLLANKAEQDSKKSPVVTPSNRTSFDTKKMQELSKKLMSFRGNDNDKQKLVEEYLGL